jgi:hypothetical protein
MSERESALVFLPAPFDPKGGPMTIWKLLTNQRPNSPAITMANVEGQAAEAAIAAA